MTHKFATLYVHMWQWIMTFTANFLFLLLYATQLLMNMHTSHLYHVVSSITWIIWMALISLYSVRILKPVFSFWSSLQSWCSSHQWALHADHRLVAPWGAWQWATSPSDAIRSEPMKRFTHLQRKAFYPGPDFLSFFLTSFPFRVMNRTTSIATKLGM